MKRTGLRLADRMPDRFGSLRTRLALLYSTVLFVLAAVMVGGIYLGLSRALSDEPTSRLARFEQLATLGAGLASRRRSKPKLGLAVCCCGQRWNFFGWWSNAVWLLCSSTLCA